MYIKGKRSSRVYVFSPSVHVDATWTPVKEYFADALKQGAKTEKYPFDSCEPAQLQHSIDTLQKGINFMEQNKSTAFDWLFLKSERIREKSAVFNERYYSAVKRKQSSDLIQRQQ